MYSQHKLPLFLAAFLFLAALGCLFYLKSEIGVPWDEPWEQALAKKSFDYVSGKNTDLLLVQNKYHGAWFESLTEVFARQFDAFSFSQKLRLRRTVLILFFLSGAFFLFLAAKKISQNNWLALLAICILFFTPRILAHAAVNTKDVPILAVACFFLWASLGFWKKPTIFFAALSGLGAGMMIALRIPAVYLVPLWVLLWLIESRKQSFLKNGTQFLVFLAFTLLSTYAFWPILWEAPLSNFKNAWVFMSRYPWENDVLFMGNFISALKLPWYYVPVWMGITIPTGWLFLFVVAAAVFFFTLFKQPKESGGALFLLGFVFIPIAAVIFLKSVIYDEWRHLFFIYPGFILFVIWGLGHLMSYAKRPIFIQATIVLVCLAQVAETGIWSARNKPHLYLYFNPWIRPYVCGNFEQDYWGFSYKQANDFLLTRQEAKLLKVCYAHLPGVYNYWNIPNDGLKKLHRVPFDEADYLVTTHRFERDSVTFGKMVYEITANRCAIVTVYQKQ